MTERSGGTSDPDHATSDPDHALGDPEHTPRRPDWICRNCYRPWPCPARQAALAAEAREHPVAVALYLATCYQEAASQLTDVPAEVLYRRIIGWLPRPRPGGP